MRKNEIWSVVVHPLATLATDDLPSLFEQVVLLVQNTGSTFASTELVFRSLPDDVVLEAEDDEEDEEDDDRGEEFADESDDDEADDDEGGGEEEDGRRR
jgi:hypothetical protein